MVTKNKVGWVASGRRALLYDCGDRGVFAFWTCRFPLKNLFPFPLVTALIVGIVSTNRQSGDNVVLSSCSATMLAHLIYFLNKRRDVNLPKNLQKKLVRLTYLRCKLWFCQYIGADVFFPPKLIVSVSFTSWIGKADRRGEICRDVAYKLSWCKWKRK